MSDTSQTSPPVPPEAPPSRRALWVMVSVGVILLGLGVWLVIAKLPRLLTAPTNGNVTPAAASAPAASPTETRKIHATLFYVSSSGDELVPVSREVPYGSTPGEQARRIVEAQIQAAPEGMFSAIPAGTALRTIYLTPNGQAFVDFSSAIAKNHTGGTLDEILAVYAIVDALTVNLADVSSVQILVDGKEVETLAGHVDLRTPLARSLKWIRKGQ
jgi:spore germination protein GerM